MDFLPQTLNTFQLIILELPRAFCGFSSRVFLIKYFSADHALFMILSYWFVKRNFELLNFKLILLLSRCGGGPTRLIALLLFAVAASQTIKPVSEAQRRIARQPKSLETYLINLVDGAILKLESYLIRLLGGVILELKSYLTKLVSSVTLDKAPPLLIVFAILQLNQMSHNYSILMFFDKVSYFVFMTSFFSHVLLMYAFIFSTLFNFFVLEFDLQRQSGVDSFG